MPKPSNTALVAGATGVVGTAVASHLAGLDGWTVLGASRRSPSHPVDGVSYVSLDLADPQSCGKRLRSYAPVSHIFFCARATHSDQPVESISENRLLLENTVETVDCSSAELCHVHLTQGGKYYGVHLGPFPTPAREGQGRCLEPNFYHAQQDYLSERSAAADWTWSASRPNTLLHYSPHIPRNIVSTLGAYAAIRAELGMTLEFPGAIGAYSALTQVTTVQVLASAAVQIATDPDCACKAFNITNTDVFRWSAIWTELARRFGIRRGRVRRAVLAESMTDKQEVWRRICEKHDLRRTALRDVANWPFADATLERDWDEILCHNRARRHGLDGWDDSIARFFKILEAYRRDRILP